MEKIVFETPEDVAQAVAIQQQLRERVRVENDFSALEMIAGVDVGYDMVSEKSFAIAVLMSVDMLLPVVLLRAELPTTFPYVPGLLSFREIPVVLEVLKKLPRRPDLVMVDGQGVAHPRRLGIASHLGVLMDIPTIGVAKSKLVGSYEKLGDEPGATRALMHKGEQIGTVLRSKQKCLPLFISPGHRVDQATALSLVKRCLKGYRLPEPTRIADKFSKRGLRDHL